jgi:hypothetical protein
MTYSGAFLQLRDGQALALAEVTQTGSEGGLFDIRYDHHAISDDFSDNYFFTLYVLLGEDLSDAAK